MQIKDLIKASGLSESHLYNIINPVVDNNLSFDNAQTLAKITGIPYDAWMRGVVQEIPLGNGEKSFIGATLKDLIKAAPYGNDAVIEFAKKMKS